MDYPKPATLNQEIDSEVAPYNEDEDSDHSGLDDEELAPYYKAMEEHDGFGDLPTLRDSFGLIIPYNEPYGPSVQLCAEKAIKKYNKENVTKYEFIKILKVNQKAAVGRLLYITFEVKPIGTPQEFPKTTFEAKVLSGIRNLIEVDFCRLKGSNRSNSSD